MDAVAVGARVARRLSVPRDASAILAAFFVTLFLSALLLFSVQPMFARMVLPKLGGTPSVWAVSMCFFQAVLLAGYCYAHLLNRLKPARLVPLVHMCVLSLALLAMPVGLPHNWSEPPTGDAYLWLIGLLGAGVGLPFFAVSANAPLLQAWFARTGHPHAADPYFLYGASNLGSLIALLAYPVLIEPFAGLETQAALWLCGFIVLGLSIAGCGLLSFAGNRDEEAAAAPSDTETAAPTHLQRVSWVCFAFVPSGLLVAFTSYLTTDIASAPFLWVIPLAMFLGTFILVFRDVPLISHRTMLLLQPLLVAIVLYGLSTPGNDGWMIAAIPGTLAFFVTTMVCHRQLYELRPGSRHLTEFYLWMSFGGVLGGFFAAIVSPQLFNTILEFPLLLMLGMAMRPGVWAHPGRRNLVELGAFVALALLIMAGMSFGRDGGLVSSTFVDYVRNLIIATAGVLALLNTPRPLRQLVCIGVAGVALVSLPSAINRGHAERSFFGVHRVANVAGGQVRVLIHGTTLHGAQRVKDAQGRPVVGDPVPMAYYYPHGPLASGLNVARQVTGKSGAEFRGGVIGLGAGVMACNTRPGERWRFFEIDPVVVNIATDPKQFTYLSHCQPGADVVLGDARQTIAKESDGSFDFLMIDAFASDAIPVHLLTREAIALYLRKLSPNGLLALHVSNRHLDLDTIATSTAGSVPGTFVGVSVDRVKDGGLDASSSHVVFVTRSAKTFQEIKRLPFEHDAGSVVVTPWTDDFSNIISAIWRKAWASPPT